MFIGKMLNLGSPEFMVAGPAVNKNNRNISLSTNTIGYHATIY